MRATHEIYSLLEAARQRLLQRRWRTAAQRVEAAWLEAELYAYEAALVAGRGLPDLDASPDALEGTFPR